MMDGAIDAELLRLRRAVDFLKEKMYVGAGIEPNEFAYVFVGVWEQFLGMIAPTGSIDSGPVHGSERNEERVVEIVERLNGSYPRPGTVVVDGWQPIEDELPPLNEPVLFCCIIDGVFTDVEKGEWAGERAVSGALVMDYGDESDWYPCSHWMPLPAGPEVE